jgi:hypothetical protein
MDKHFLQKVRSQLPRHEKDISFLWLSHILCFPSALQLPYHFIYYSIPSQQQLLCSFSLLPHLFMPFLDAFAKFRKATISSVHPSDGPHATTRLTERIFTKFGT